MPNIFVEDRSSCQQDGMENKVKKKPHSIGPPVGVFIALLKFVKQPYWTINFKF